MSRYALFDRSRLQLRPLSERANLVPAVESDGLWHPEQGPGDYQHPDLDRLAAAIRAARRAGRPVIWMIGAHVIKQGLSRLIVELIERGVITHLATNGAGLIHDYELAWQGQTSEEVARYVRDGRFGMWRETGQLNEIARLAAARGDGFGEAVGRTIEQERFPYRHLSVAAAGWRCRVPVTCHASIGCDIIHQHPNCDGAAVGAASYTDFLIFAHSVQELEGGVFLNVGSAVTGPEVYLKALSMARNVARQQGRCVCRFTTAVFDLLPLPADYRLGVPPKTEPLYYYRPWKTILVRTVQDGGQSYYFCGDHRQTLPALYRRLRELTDDG